MCDSQPPAVRLADGEDFIEWERDAAFSDENWEAAGNVMLDPERVRHRVQGAIADGKVAHRVIAHVAWDQSNPSEILAECELLGDSNEVCATEEYLKAHQGDELLIRDLENGARSIQFPRAFWHQMDGSRAIFVVDEVRIDFQVPPPTTPTRYWFNAQLTPSGIATRPCIVSPHPNGAIEVKGAGSGVVEFESGFGGREIAEAFQYHSDRKFGNDIRVSTQGTAISGEIALAPGSTLTEAHGRLVAELTVACRILSMCFRLPVQFYDIRYSEEWTESMDRPPLNACVRFRRPTRELGEWDRPLIDLRHLMGGGFQRLLDAWTTANDDDRMSRAVSFLSTSYTEDLLEASFILAFAALELTIELCDHDRKKRLTPKIKRKIDEFLGELAAIPGCGQAADVARKKLGELLRRPIAERIISTVEVLKIEVGNISSFPFEEIIGRATKIRNALVHSALVTDSDAMHVAGVRIRALTERLLLHTLGWPVTELDPRCDLAVSQVFYER